MPDDTNHAPWSGSHYGARPEPEGQPPLPSTATPATPAPAPDRAMPPWLRGGRWAQPVTVPEEGEE